MITKDQILRINELYKKRKDIGLSNEEQEEEKKLRELYIQSFRENLKSQLNNIKIVSPEEYEQHKKESKCSCGHDHHGHDEDCGCGCKEHKH